MKLRKLFALFSIALIMTIPFAVAQSLNVQRFAGQDNVDGVAKSTDILEIEVLANIPGDLDGIQSDQVRLTTRTGITYLFTSCEVSQGSFYNCEMTFELSGEGGTSDYTIALHNDDGDAIISEVRSLTNDFVAPEIISFSADPQILGAGTTELTFTARDYSFIPGDTSACAGVGHINLYEDGTVGNPTGVIPGGSECELSGAFDYSPQSTGEISLCAVAFDRLGKESVPVCTDIVVDRSPPIIKGFRIFSPEGYTLHAIHPSGIIANIEVTIEDDSIAIGTIRGDFGDLADSLSWNNVAPSSTGTGTERKVVWTNIPIEDIDPCTFTIRAADTLGNAEQKIFTCTLISDTTPPVPIGIDTGFTLSDGTPLLGVQGILTIIFDEAGGMEKADAFLDATSLGLGSNRKADGCFLEGANWECDWQLPGNVPSGSYTVTVLPNTADDLGNDMDSTQQYPIEYDSEPPAIVSGPEVEVFYPADDYGQQLVKGATVQLVYNLTGADFAVGNFSPIGGPDEGQAVCSSTGLCTFAEEVLRSGSYIEDIELIFFDEAGNFVEDTWTAESFGILNEIDPNYWTSTVTCSPEVLDRSSTALINHQVYCHIQLSSQDPSVEVVASALGPLSDCTGDLTSAVADIGLINNGFLSEDPYLRILLQTRDFPEEKFNLTCPLLILTKVGDDFTQFPEIENISVDIRFGTSAMGALGANIDDKIEDAVDRAERLNKWLDVAVKFLSFVDKICFLRQMLINIQALWELHHVVLNIVSKATMGSTEAIRSAACIQKSGTLAGYAGIDEILQPVCALANCKGLTEVLGKLGVGDLGPISDIEKFVGDPLLPGEKGIPTAIVDVKQSIVWSTLTLCIPGVIYNVDKYRQIECRYATCLKRDVKEAGVPISVCDDEKDYLQCNYFYGQLFNSIPFAHLVQYGIGVIKEVLSNPFAALGLLIGLACPATCGSGDLNIACSLAKTFDIVGEVIDDVQAIRGEDFFSLGSGPCDDLKEVLEDD